jgi:hypothetical protein
MRSCTIAFLQCSPLTHHAESQRILRFGCTPQRVCEGKPPFRRWKPLGPRWLYSDRGAGRHGRRIPVIDELMVLPITMKAKLCREEVIAVVLYTGPMVRSS